MISIKDILDKNQITKESLFKTFTDLATAAKVPVSALGPLEPLRAFIEQLCEWLALVWNGYLLNVIRGGFLDTAEGVFLTILAWTMFGVARRTETFGHADALSLENRGGGVFNFAPGDVRIKNSADKTFHNVTSGQLVGWSGSGAYPTVELDFEADEAGSGSNTLSTSCGSRVRRCRVGAASSRTRLPAGTSRSPTTTRSG